MQDPTVHWQNPNRGALQTIIRNCHLMFADASSIAGVPSCQLEVNAMHSRWLLPSELLLAQGFRTDPFYIGDYVQSSFSTLREGRSPAEVAKQAGNSMHCNVAGICWAHMLVHHCQSQSHKGVGQPAVSVHSADCADACDEDSSFVAALLAALR